MEFFYRNPFLAIPIIIAVVVLVLNWLDVFEFSVDVLPVDAVAMTEAEAANACKAVHGATAGYYIKHDGSVLCTKKLGARP